MRSCPAALLPDPPSLLRRLGWLGRSLLLAVLLLGHGEARAAGPVVWDEDGDGLDDRIGVVQLLGYRYSFENADSLARQRFEVTRVGATLVFGIYVRYTQPPDDSDLAALALIGVPVRHRLVSLPAIRSSATEAQAKLIRALPHVDRVEVVPYLYSSTRDGVAALGVREPGPASRPDLASLDPTADGRGVVVAILDSGVNDEPFGAFPGHESLLGRCVGGAEFTSGDSLTDTPRAGSVNPVDPGLGPSSGHGTHVASIILGSGGASAYARGVAPAARFVDVRVLGTAGAGTGLPEALDWCLVNQNRDWGSPDSSYRGIDVLNLSLSSTDRSDGTDLASQLCSLASAAGVAVVASMGNDGLSGHVPSPAAGDGVIAVGAIDVQRTSDPADDLEVAWDNTGPRDSDQDADTADELKPLVLAPGTGILAADGDPMSNGARYRRRSGTSQAAAFVSGAVACLRSSGPSMSPAALASLLTSTARRNGPGLPPGATMLDPRWSPARGFGVLDVAAAATERADSNHTQVRRLSLSGSADTVRAELTTMRERSTSWLVYERAADVEGSPAAFAAIDSVAATGDPSLADGDDGERYVRRWWVPPAEYGTPFWYRAAWTESGVRRTGPVVRLVSPSGPRVATAHVTIVHDALDSDIGAVILAGAGAVDLTLPGSSGAVSSDWVDGVSAIGTVAWTFEVGVPSGEAANWLPPSENSPWTLRVAESGYANRSGRITDFRVVWHTGSGDLSYACPQLPQQTLEGGVTRASIPSGTTAVVGSEPATARLHPNPVRPGQQVTFALPAGPSEAVGFFDLAGRCVGRVQVPASSVARQAVWQARDVRGAPWPAGVYLARSGSGRTARLVVLAP